ncbi:MAG: hypothetical protein ACK414_05355 [Gemmobacter sp.]
MRIDLTPIRSEAVLSVHRQDEVLSVNGTAWDLSPLPEGARLPPGACEGLGLMAPVTRQGGVLQVVLALPHGLDAPEAVRFPAALDPAPQGPVDLPGHPGAAGPGAPGLIDWAQMQTAEALAEQDRIAWRAAREVTRLDLVLAMAGAGLIAPASAIAAAAGAIPAEFEPVVAAMPAPAQTEARIRWAGAATIPRLSPLILAVQAAAGMSDAAVDALFGRGA